MKLKILFFCLLLAFFFAKNVLASTAYYTESLPKWLEMLKKGDTREKKLALDHLWFLEYQEFRKDKNVFDPILEALKDKDASVREAAAACLKVIGREIPFAVSTTIVPSLINVLNEDENPRVRAEAAKALGMYRFDRKDRRLIDMEERGIDTLINALKDKDPWVRLNAVFSLGELKANKALEPLDALLEDNSDWRNKFIQQECLIALRKINPTIASDRDIIPLLMRKFNDEYLKEEVIKTLGNWRAREAMELLASATKDPNERIRKAAIEAISQLSKAVPSETRSASFQKDTAPIVDNSQIEIYISGLKDPAVSVRLQAIAALSIIKDNRPVDPLINALKDKNGEVRRNAMIALGNFSDEKILDVSIMHFGEEQYNYQDIAVKSFLSVARKTTQKTLYFRKKNGVGNNISNEGYISKKSHGRQLMVHPLAVEKLLNAFNKREDTDKGILSALSCFEDERILPLLIKNFDKRQAWFKQEAIRIASYTDSDTAFPFLIKVLKDQDKNVRKEAIMVLGQIKDKRAIGPLLTALNDKDDDLRASAINALMNYDDPRVLDLCYPLLNDKSSDVRYAAALYITNKPDKKSVEHLINILEDPKSGGLALAAADALSVMKDERAVEPLIKALKRPPEGNSIDGFESGLRLHAATALGKIGNKKAVPALIECLSNEKNDKYLRQHAAKALKHIDDPIALKAIAAVPEDWLHEIESAKKVSKPPVPIKMPANIPGYPVFGFD